MTLNKLTMIATTWASIYAAIACQSAGASATLDHQGTHSDAPAVHGMLLFGTKNLWLSHLPMFHKPHDYQVIMKVTLKKDGEDLLPFYLNDREQHNASYYTFVPKKFSMSHLVAGQLTQIEGTLVREHFERGGVPLLANVVAEINAVPVKEQFISGAEKPATASYYVLGDKEETWLAHKIVVKPDEFDQVITATVTEDFWLENQSGSVLTTSLNNTPDARLDVGTEVEAMDQVGKKFSLSAGAEIYIETGDLDL